MGPRLRKRVGPGAAELAAPPPEAFSAALAVGDEGSAGAGDGEQGDQTNHRKALVSRLSEARGSGDARRLGLVGLGLCGLFRLVAAGRRQRQVGIGVGDGLPLILDIGVEGHLDVVVQQRFEDHEAYAVQVGAGNGDLDDYPYTVPEGGLWVMGDNRTNSQDSRYFGAIKESSVTGKAIFIYWPLTDVGPL